MAITDTRIRISAQDDASPAFATVADNAGRMQNALRGSVPDMDRLGISAKQTAAAMRGIPAQMTDIVVSLQAGQAPLTVLMQQGGQLKDMFGGVGNAAKALGGYVLGMVNPFTIAAAAVGVLGLAYYQGSKEAGEYAKALIMTGNAAGATVGQMKASAAAVAQLTGATQGAAAEAITALASSGNVAARDFERFGAIAVKVQRETGVAVSETAKQFAELGKDPLQASIKLNDSTRFLTASVYEQVKALTDQGRAAAAASLAQTAYATAMDTRTAQLAGNLGLIEKAWRGITDGAKGAWDAMLGVGRKTSIAEELTSAQAELQSRQKRGPLNDSGGMVASYEKGNEALRQRIANLNELVRMEKRGADAAAAGAAQVKARIEWDKEGEKYLDKAAQLKRDIAEAENQGAAAGMSAAQIATRIADIRAKASDHTLKAAKADAWLTEVTKTYTKAMDDLAKVQHKASAEAEHLSKTQEKLRDIMGAPEWLSYSRQRQEQLIYAAALAQAEEDNAEALKASAKAAQIATNEYADLVEAQQKIAAQLGEQVDKEREHIAILGLSKEAAAELAAEQMMVQAARKDAIADRQVVIHGEGAISDAYREQAKNLRELAQLKRQGAAKEAGIDSSRALAKDMERTSEQINSSLTDALMRGFESGKGFAKNMGDTVVNMFKTMVLRPIVSAVVNPISQGINNYLYGGQQGGGGLIGNALGTYATNGLSGMGSTIGGWFGGAAATGTGIAATMGTGTALAATSSGIGLGASAAGTGYGFAAGGGLGMTAGSAGASTIGAGLGTSAAAGGTSVLAAIPVWGWIALAAIAIASQMGGETRGGGQYSYSFDGSTAPNARRGGTVAASGVGPVLLEGPSGGEQFGDVVRQSITGTVAGINDLFKNMGSTTVLTAFQAGLETSDNARGGVFSGGTLSTGATFGETGKGDNYLGTLFESTSTQSPKTAEEAMANFSTDLVQAAIQALQAATDNPKVIADKLKDVDAESLSDQAAKDLLGSIAATVQGIANFRAAIESLPFEALKGLSFDAAQSLIAVAGGVDKLSAGLGSYYDNFFTEAEKTANVTAQVSKAFTDLGLQMPDLSQGADSARLAFRSLVDGAMADTSEQGQKTTVALLGISGAMGGLITSAASATSAVVSLSTRLQTMMDKLTASRDQALTVAQSAMQGVNDAIGSAKDAAHLAYDNTISALDAQEAALTTAYQLAVKSQNQFKESAANARNAAMAGLDAERKAAASAYQSAVGAIADERKTSVAAFNAASKAIGLSIDAAQHSIGLLRGLDGSLGNALDYFQRADKSLESRQSGQAQILAALADAKGGKFPTAESLADALAAVTQPSEQFFSSFEDYQRDYLKTAISISDLSKLTGTQLSTEEQSLQVLTDSQALMQSQHEDHMARLDAAKDVLDANYEALQALFAVRADSIASTYAASTATADTELERLRSQYESALAGIDMQRTAARSTLDDVVGKLDAQLAIAQKQYEAALGLDKPLTDIAAALAGLSTALGNFKTIDTALDVAKVDFGNPNISSTAIKSFVADALAQSKDGTGADAAALLYQYAIANGLSTNQIAGSGANPILTQANLNNYTSANNLPGIDSVLTSNSTALADTATVQAAAQVESTTALGRVKKFVADMTAQANWATMHPDWAQELYDYAQTVHARASEVDAAIGASTGTTNQWALAHGYPAFRYGGLHSGGLRWVGEDGPELEATGPARIWNVPQIASALSGGTDTQRLEDLVTKLTAEVVQLRATVDRGNDHGRRSAEALTGGIPILVEVAE